MADEQTPQQGEAAQKSAPQASPLAVPPAAPATGRRPAFQALKIELTDAELASSGTQKCILDMLNRSEEECNDLKEFRKKFHESDKRVGVLEENLKTNKVVEVMFAVGVGVGCAIIGLAPFLWEMPGNGHLAGEIAVVVGGVLTLGATVARIFYK